MEARPNTHHAREYLELVAQILLPITIGRQISTLFRSSNNHNYFILIIINWYQSHVYLWYLSLPSSSRRQPGSRSPPDQSLWHFEFKLLNILVWLEITSSRSWKLQQTVGNRIVIPLLLSVAKSMLKRSMMPCSSAINSRAHDELFLCSERTSWADAHCK